MLIFADTETADNPVMKSRLSADAPEFVPKYIQQYQNDNDPQVHTLAQQ